MSWKEFLVERARKTASRRKRIYGIEPASRVAVLLTEETPALRVRETSRLLAYLLFKSPQRRLELFWKYITDKDTPVRRQQIEALAEDLRPHLSENCRVAVNYFERRNYSRDLARVPALMEKILHRTTPTLVVQAKTEKDISSLLSYCNSKEIAVFPRGSGSFALGGSVPTRNGIVIDLSPMMAVLEVDPEAQTVRVQPGARWADVATQLEPYGLIPRTSPTSRFSTVAGWISTGGMGLDSYAYGRVHDSVISIRVARPDGSIVMLNSKDDSIKDLFETEGQLGILTEITLRVRPKPGYSGAGIITFSDRARAFEFLDEVTSGDFQPSHIVFFDREYQKRENVLFKDQTQLENPIVPEKETILLHFDIPEDEQKFTSFLHGNSQTLSAEGATVHPENGAAARYMWANRYFPLKAQRIGPGLLGSEVLLPRKNILKYFTKVEKLSRHLQIEPAMEVILCGNNQPHNTESFSYNQGSNSYLLIVSFCCDYSKPFHYVMSLLYIQLLVWMAIRQQGAPYGVGIWNTPFVKKKYPLGELNKLKKVKAKIDPNGILNPNKFFKVKGRFFSLPSLFLRPLIFRPVLAMSQLISPVLGLVARLTGPKPQSGWDIPAIEANGGEDLLHQSASRCTSCGACISVCPAYQITHNELVTGRAKLRMAEAMTNGIQLERSEAHAAFQCLHCGLCEEVCQTHLPLRDCYLLLEDRLENRFGSPEDSVQNFIEELDNRREFIRNVFSLDLPDWSPDEKMARVPVAERSENRGTA
ncbi:MAG: FAD-binding protein [Candidatus Aminicenantes bacterium]|jgi:FAD/FMN-containing dehydrogenase/ferredoxin